MPAFPDIHLFLGSTAAGVCRPLAQFLPQIISCPKSAVIHRLQTFHPAFYFRLIIRSVCNSIDCFAVTFGNSRNIFRRTAAAFNFQNLYAGIHNLIQERNRTQVFRRHHILVFQLNLKAGFLIDNRVFLAAVLFARTAIRGRIMRMQTQITFSGYRHAQGTMSENFYFHQFAGRSFDLFFFNLVADLFNLGNAKFAAHHHSIRKQCIKLHRFDIGNINLRGNMNFHADLARIRNHGLVHRDNCSQVGCLGFIQQGFD